MKDQTIDSSLSFVAMNSSVYRPYIIVRQEKRSVGPVFTEDDRTIFSVIDHLMGSRRSWIGLNGQFLLKDETGRVIKMGSAGMAPEELRVRKFMESCTFKAMISCVGG